MERAIYYISGSPCCGKSTLAMALAARHGMTHVRCDDYEGPFMERGVREDVEPIIRLTRHLTAGKDDMWLRPPEELLADEVAYYEASFSWMMEAVESHPGRLVAEGAALLPWKLAEAGIPAERVLCLTPTEEFQRTQYAQRRWVADYLADCSDRERAFDNWMNRDAALARRVAEAAREIGYAHWTVDGTRPAEETLRAAERWFGLKKEG